MPAFLFALIACRASVDDVPAEAWHRRRQHVRIGQDRAHAVVHCRPTHHPFPCQMEGLVAIVFELLRSETSSEVGISCPDRARGFESPYSGAHFMLLSLIGDHPIALGKVSYAPAFAALG